MNSWEQILCSYNAKESCDWKMVSSGFYLDMRNNGYNLVISNVLLGIGQKLEILKKTAYIFHQPS